MSIVVWVLTGLLLLVTAAPLIRVAHGAVRALAFPRLQVLAGLVALAVIVPFVLEESGLLWALLLLAGAAALQAANVARFTPLWSRQSVRAEPALAADPEARVSILACNVKMSNRDYARLIGLVREEEPDLFFAVETDDGWVEALSVLRPLFAHHVERPQDNAYGLVVYSRLPMDRIQVRDLVVEGVPSVRARVRTRGREPFRLTVVHPEPPVPYMDSEGRDAELALVGMEARDDPLPAVVAGDLNDVAWSYTTRRFQRLSGLLDPRVGRGFYNTFDARFPLIRWPLDHLFHDPRFRLVGMRRLPPIGSDHFPMRFDLALTPGPASHEEPEESDAQERGRMKGMIHGEQDRDREAIGSDWEDD